MNVWVIATVLTSKRWLGYCFEMYKTGNTVNFRSNIIIEWSKVNDRYIHLFVYLKMVFSSSFCGYLKIISVTTLHKKSQALWSKNIMTFTVWITLQFKLSTFIHVNISTRFQLTCDKIIKYQCILWPLQNFKIWLYKENV